jgi:hypothetical protein
VPVSVGVDFAWLIDTTAIVPLWLRDEGFRLFGDPEILTPPRDGTMLDVEEVKEAFHRILAGTRSRWWCWTGHGRRMSRSGSRATSASDRHPAAADERVRIEDYDNWMQAMRDKVLRHTGHREFRRHVLNAIARRMPGTSTGSTGRTTSRNTKAGRQERRVIDALTAASMVHSVSPAS